jgi:hypothetical protein
MMRKLLHAAAVILLAGNALLQAQDFPWHLYAPSTLHAVVKEHEADATKYKDNGQLVFTKGRPYRVKVAYTGQSRPVSPERKELLQLWTDAYGIDKEKYLGLYENEYLFTEDGADFWLPVQTPVSKYFDRELMKGEMVALYVQFVGGKRDKKLDKADWIFLVNEFQKIKPKE